ncbi:MAG: RidA family protein [Cyclonatronaceae bacterium]
MKRSVIKTPAAPEAIGPYSQAVVHENMVYCSGQIGLVPEGMELVSADVGTQTEQVMQNMKAVLEAAGCSFEHVLKCSIFILDMEDFPIVNDVYGRYFDAGRPPARETVAVRSLPKGAKVEISCIACKS